jgi:hypothetical protein
MGSLVMALTIDTFELLKYYRIGLPKVVWRALLLAR